MKMVYGIYLIFYQCLLVLGHAQSLIQVIESIVLNGKIKHLIILNPYSEASIPIGHLELQSYSRLVNHGVRISFIRRDHWRQQQILLINALMGIYTTHNTKPNILFKSNSSINYDIDGMIRQSRSAILTSDGILLKKMHKKWKRCPPFTLPPIIYVIFDYEERPTYYNAIVIKKFEGRFVRYYGYGKTLIRIKYDGTLVLSDKTGGNQCDNKCSYEESSLHNEYVRQIVDLSIATFLKFSFNINSYLYSNVHLKSNISYSYRLGLEHSKIFALQPHTCRKNLKFFQSFNEVCKLYQRCNMRISPFILHHITKSYIREFDVDDKIVQHDVVPKWINPWTIGKSSSTENIRVVMAISPPFRMWKNKNIQYNYPVLVTETNISQLTGYSIDAFKIVMDKMNTKYSITVHHSDTATGNENEFENGVTGLLQSLTNGDFDMFIDGVYSQTRGKYVKGTTAIISKGIGFVVATNGKIDIFQNMFRIFRSLSPLVWILACICILLVSFLLYIILKIEFITFNVGRKRKRVEPRQFKKAAEMIGKEKLKYDQNHTYLWDLSFKTLVPKIWRNTEAYRLQNSNQYVVKRDISSYMVAVFTTANYGFKPDYWASRILILFWWIFCLVLTQSYTAKLTALLTVENKRVPIQSMNDIAKHSEYIPLAINGTSTTAMLKLWQFEPYQTIYERLQIISNRNQAVEYVQNGYYVFLDNNYNLMELTKEYCNLEMIYENDGERPVAFMVSQEFRYYDFLNNIIANIEEMGIFARLRNKYWPPNAPKTCSNEKTEDNGTLVDSIISKIFKPKRNQYITIYQIIGVFIVWAIGTCLSLIICLIEKLVGGTVCLKTTKSQ
ncbi:hypothetical protein SNEBB_006549 [Seison nebaliae]|nr:hypothetical protein SNEBB_006549 [Seison nebaliae]